MKAKKDGIQINQEVESCEIAFTGDTTIDAVLRNEMALNARILICELTEVDIDTDSEAFKTFGHIHMTDIKNNQDKFKND